MSQKGQLVIFQGISGSGKTTKALEMKKKDPNIKIVTRDDIRHMLDGFRKSDTGYSKGNENFVKSVRDYIITEGLKKGHKVISADTNLHEKTLGELISLANNLDVPVIIDDSFLQVPLEECIKRDSKRIDSVGEMVIRSQWNEYYGVKGTSRVKYIEQDPNLPLAYICDIDGTASLGPNNRSAYDESKVSNDEPNIYVRNLLKSFINTHTILFVSGRTNGCREATTDWIIKHYGNIFMVGRAKLFMRNIGDNRKDAIVKEEIYNTHIKGRYFISGVFDDRLSTSKLWYSLGLPLFRVGDPEANF